jgi:amino acid adenylation domain-containing protein
VNPPGAAIKPVETSIPRRGDRGPCALSFAQQRLWFLDQLEADRLAYNQPTALRLRGRLDVSALRQALDRIVARHEILRTTFIAADGIPAQVVAAAGAAEFVETDLTPRSHGEIDAGIDRALAASIRRPFDLSRGPMLRALLLRIDADEHILLLVMHHIACDGWSMDILRRELAAFYRAIVAKESPRLPELPVQYADYALWQRRQIEEALDIQLAYWRGQLDGVAALDLPTDRPRPALQSFRGKILSFALSGNLAAALKELGRSENATPFMVLLAAFQTLLHRLTGQDDIAVGAPIAGRNRTEIEGLIGFFANTLVLRADLSGDPSFRDLLARTRRVALDAYAHQDAPFEKLVEELRPERSLSRPPLFQVMFGYQNTPAEIVEMPGLAVSRVRVDGGAAKFDLSLFLREEPEGLSGSLEYNTDLFDDATAARMLGYFRTLLEGIAADADRRLSELRLLTEAERRRLLIEWNDTRRDYPSDRCVHHLFEAQAERTPDAIAVVSPAESEENGRCNYRELNRRANRLAHHLQKLAVGPDTLVTICLERSLDMIVAVLAVLKAGGAYVPLDPSYPKGRLAFMLEDARPAVLVTRRELDRVLPAHTLRTVRLDADRDVIAQESDENPQGGAGPANPAYALYTSGSTGAPKAAAMPHRALCNLISWQLENFAPPAAARTLQFASLSFDVSFQEIFTALCSGGTLVVATEEVRRDPRPLLQFLKTESIERLFLPFVALQQLAEEAAGENEPLPRIREIIAAGEPLQITPQISALFRRFKNCRLVNQYGPTETHVATSFTLTGPPDGWPALAPIGRPISNTEIYLLDAHLRPAPIGVAAELYIGGDGLAHGYLNRPELTAEKFIAHPFSDKPQARLYRTGDLARYKADGEIEFLGRSDDQIKIRGFRVEPGEIESALRRHQDVRECAVVAHGETPLAKRLIAYVVFAGESRSEPLELRDFLQAELPDYMLPSVFVALDALPLTPSGKLDRRALPPPTPAPAEDRRNYRAPSETLEEQVARIWEELVEARPMRVEDNFFDVGGHSLLAVRLMHRIEEDFGERIPLSRFLAGPSIRQLAAALLEQRTEGDRSLLVRVQEGRDKPPFFYLHGDFFNGGFYCIHMARHLGAERPFYALAPHGLNGTEIPPTIAAMADSYIDMLRAVRPHGPYFLGGYCNGGAVAYEMARKLHQQGETVPLLVVIAANARTSFYRRALHAIIEGIGNVSGLTAEQRLDLFLSIRGMAHKGRAIYRRLSGRKQYRPQVSIDDFSETFEGSQSLRLFMGFGRALYGYVPKPYTGRMLCLWPEQHLGISKDPTGGWGVVAPRLELKMVPGGHTTCLEYHLKTIAEHMRRAIIQAEDDSASPGYQVSRPEVPQKSP